ncbi:PIN domain-containing protein [Rhodopila sp.]|uniref:PIN domain-containing protein n=1 Tax=Rhodopila sp. TaxID=2480087 RepID=UPI003D0A15B8
MILLDTNVIFELMRPEPDAVVLRWMAAQKDALYVTALSYAEIRGVATHRRAATPRSRVRKARRWPVPAEEAAACRCVRAQGKACHWTSHRPARDRSNRSGYDHDDPYDASRVRGVD